jgi:hypothetical protein
MLTTLKDIKMTIKQRWKAETPDFWKKVQKIGLGIGAIGGIIISGTIALPTTVITIGGYMVAVGSVTAVLSKLTIKNGQDND